MSRYPSANRPDARHAISAPSRPRETDRDSASLHHHPLDQFLEFLAASPLQVRMETWSGFRPACSSPSRRTTLLHRREVALARREAASSRSRPERAPFNEIVARYLKAVATRVSRE